ncbi:DUF4358 domain-containing protein [Dorea sp. D27]|uniref:DUF4358 domain-containing protein n=1 Tax=Dorea sp. D27 TaxID=658665 RepID=UPI0006735B07|nr:DUF4358 domain-containing protein [Dorea sp. D27]KMZ55890.1 hypothetical protein HMPREF0980_00007 [Dorea sp. D27]
MKSKEKSMLDFINICKYLLVLLLIAYVILLISKEGGTNTPIKTVNKNVLSVMGTEGMKKGTTQDLKKYYGLNADDYKGVTLYIPDDVMGVNELLIVQLTDVSQAESVEQAAQARLDTQKESFEGYGAAQTKLIRSAVLESRGDYVLLAVTKKADAVQGAYRKSL